MTAAPAPGGPATSGRRLNRYLAERGVASRRRADELIAAGRVALNGVPARLGTRVGAADVVTVDGARVMEATAAPVTLALHKPAGVVSTLADTHGRPTVRDLVPRVPGLVPIGRLDADTRGLLLLSSDGDLVHAVSHPRYGVPKTYAVTTSAPLDDAQLAMLRAGVELDDGPARALEVARTGRRSARVVMGEGRKREVRRMLAAAGAEVADLCRMAVGPIALGDLPEGATRELTGPEVLALRQAASL